MGNRLSRGYSEAFEEPKKSWLVTFNDLLTLIFTFFALLLAFSTPSQKYISQAGDSFRKVWGITSKGEDRGAIIPRMVEPIEDKDIAIEKAKRIMEIRSRLETLKTELLALHGEFPHLSYTAAPLAMTVEVPASFVFISGSANIQEKAATLLKRVADASQRVVASIRVEIREEPGGGRKEAGAVATINKVAAVADYLSSTLGIPPERVSVALPSSDGINRPGNSGRVIIVISPGKL